MKIKDISVEYIQHVGSDLQVVNSARVSFDKVSEWEVEEEYGKDEQGDYSVLVNKLSEKDTKLIKYLAKHKHFSPFNHSFITLRVSAPVFVARQLVKHRFMPWNEVSRRYVDEEPEFYCPDNWRKRSENVKQGSSEETTLWPALGWSNASSSLKDYNKALEEGVCPEMARMLLPQSMLTSWYWSGTLGAYCDMLRLRLDPHTQKETREVAEKIKEIIEPLFPVSVQALLDVK